MNSGAAVTITVKRSEADETCLSHFTALQIDGKTWTKDTDYTAVSGSTVLTLQAKALGTLGVGRHTVTILFDDGKAATELTVKDPNGSPITGDDGPGLWGTTLVLSGAALASLVLFLKKRAYTA